MELECKSKPFSGWSSKSTFTLKDANVMINKNIVGRLVLKGLRCQDASIMIKRDIMHTLK